MANKLASAKNSASQLRAIAYWTIGGGGGFKRKKGTLTKNKSYAVKVNKKAMKNRTARGYKPGKKRSNYGERTKMSRAGVKGSTRKRIIKADKNWTGGKYFKKQGR